MNDSYRATGRTFRMLLKAIIAASEAEPGTTINVIGYNDNSVMELLKGASGILGSYIHSDCLTFSSRNRTIEIVGASTLKFTTGDHQVEDTRGHRVTINMYDHYTGRP